MEIKCGSEVSPCQKQPSLCQLPHPPLSYLSRFWNSKANCIVCPDLKQPWILEIETFLNAEIIYLPETGPNQQILHCTMEMYTLTSDNRGIYNQKKTSPPTCSMLRSLSEGELLPLSSCELSPYLAPTSGSKSTLAFSEPDTHHSSLLGEMLERLFLWCCDKRPPRTSHSLFRSAESVPSERKPRMLSEYILMHFQPPTRAHKAIRPATDERTCRKVI